MGRHSTDSDLGVDWRLDRIGSVGWEGCDDYDDRIIRTSGNTARGCVNKWLMVLGINARDAVVEVHREY